MSISKPSLLQYVPNMMTALLVMILAASLAKLVWIISTPSQAVGALAAPLQPIVTQQHMPPKNLGRMIADNHLFGQVSPVAVPPVVPKATPKAVVKQVVKPPLAVNLHGLWAKKHTESTPQAADTSSLIARMNADLDALFLPVDERSTLKVKSKAHAIMSHSGGAQLMYSEGDSVAKGVTVTAILSDKVILDNRGTRQEVYLSEGVARVSDMQPPKKIATPSLPTQTVASANIQAGQVPAQASSMSNPRKRRETLGQRDLRKLREDVMDDASLLTQFSAPEPLLMDGVVKGFRLHLSNRLRLLYQVGFRPGDVVTELNGVRLNNPATVQQALYNFISSEQLSITVMRGQNEETFRYSFGG